MMAREGANWCFGSAILIALIRYRQEAVAISLDASEFLNRRGIDGAASMGIGNSSRVDIPQV
jgi:hypothetical protein